jgi:hypothetical protein
MAAASGVCPSHEHVDRTLTALVTKVDEGFENVGKILTEIRVDAARREAELDASVKGAWHEIRVLRSRADTLERTIPAAIEAHANGCSLNDITEVGIKLPARRRYDTPSGAAKPSVVPRGRWTTRSLILMGVGAAVVVTVLGIWIGARWASGSSAAATHTVQDVARAAAAVRAAQAAE